MVAEKMKDIIELGAEAGFIFQDGQRYSRHPIPSMEEENEMTDRDVARKSRRKSPAVVKEAPVHHKGEEYYDVEYVEDGDMVMLPASVVKKSKKSTPKKRMMKKRATSSKSHTAQRRRRVSKPRSKSAPTGRSKSNRKTAPRRKARSHAK